VHRLSWLQKEEKKEKKTVAPLHLLDGALYDSRLVRYGACFIKGYASA